MEKKRTENKIFFGVGPRAMHQKTQLDSKTKSAKFKEEKLMKGLPWKRTENYESNTTHLMQKH